MFEITITYAKKIKQLNNNLDTRIINHFKTKESLKISPKDLTINYNDFIKLNNLFSNLDKERKDIF